jgi:ATP-dependent RNA helicase DDX18/HAS1
MSNFDRRDDDDDDDDDDSEWIRPTKGSRDQSRYSGNRTGDRNKNRNSSNSPDRKNINHQQRRQGGALQDGDVAEITETNAHFFSKKSLNEPSFHQFFSKSETETIVNDNDKSSISNQELHQLLCQGAGITRPSRIQSLAWPQILSGNHTIVADQTGSGKTGAYLVPCLLRSLQTPSIKQNGSPKVLILAPTAELADQIRAVCLKISQTGTPFNTMVVTANGKFTTSIRDQIRMIQRTQVDVLISTPGRVSTILRTRNSGLDLSNLQSIVLDEVDILMVDETFGPQLRTVGAAAPLLEKTQFIFVTATLPDSVVETIETEFPGVVKIKGPGLHRLAPSLQENLVDVSVPADQNRNEELCFDVKAKQLLKALRQNRCRRTLIFCNTVESCRTVENLLNRKDRHNRVFEVLSYHSAMKPESRNANLSLFANGKKNNSNEDVDYILIW